MQIQLSKPLSNERRLWIGTLTRHEAEAAGIASRGADIGYFLYERTVDDDDVVVLARFFSDEAAMQIAELLNRLPAGEAGLA